MQPDSLRRRSIRCGLESLDEILNETRSRVVALSFWS